MAVATYRDWSTGDRRMLRVNVPAVLAFVALSALILNPLFGSLAALIFLLFGILLIAVRFEQNVQAFLRYWYVFVLPLYCIFSVAWSQYPINTLRHSLQLAATICISIAIAASVRPAALMRCIFSAYAIGTLGSILFGRVRDDIGAWLGIFGSKNAFASHISMFTLASVAVLFDRSASRYMRVAAFCGVLAAGPLLLKGQSAGATITLAPAVLVAALAMFSKHMTKPQKIGAGALLVIFSAVLAFVAVAYGDVIFDAVLTYSGKDVTLTGRTELWEYAWQAIQENPIFGLGYQAFWVQGYEPAEMLWEKFGVMTKSGFHFHSTYISNAVEIGMLGVALQIAILYGALISVIAWAVRSPQPINAFLAALLVLIVSKSFVEAEVFFQFSVTTVLVVIALIYALESKAATRLVAG